MDTFKVRMSNALLDTEEQRKAKDKMEEERGMQMLECIRQAQPNSLKSLLGESTVGIEYKDQYANTPLLLACLMGFCDCLRVLIQYGANYRRINLFGQNALALAAYSGDAATCEELLTVWPYKKFNKTSILTPMCIAAMHGNVDLVRYFMSIDIESPNPDKCKTRSIHGVCPLHLARVKGHHEVIQLLTPTHDQHTQAD